VWLILAGRGWGKTRTGAEDSTEFLLFPPFLPTSPLRLAVVAPTFASGRDVCIEGESGLLNTLPQPLIQNWNRSMGELNLAPNPPHNPFPSIIKLYSAEDPEALRGPQHHRAWCDELAAWKSTNIQDTWDMLMMGLRLGPNPQAVVTTTPKNKPLLHDLLSRPTTIFSTGSTFENAANLSPAALDELRRRYEGTRLGSQELYANLLTDVEGALWSARHFDAYRVPLAPITPDLQARFQEYLRALNSQSQLRDGVSSLRSDTRTFLQPNSLARAYRQVVVAVDPAMTSRRTSNWTGIVAAGLTTDSYPSTSMDGLLLPPSLHVDVLADRSIQASPDTWARRAIALYHDTLADHITYETNQGGDLVPTVIHGIDPTIPCVPVHASHGKAARAEPVVGVYDQGRVHHPLPYGDFNPLQELENQCTTWEPLEDPSSPDRLDALVWALTDLLRLDKKTGLTSQHHYRDMRLAGRR
jgi:phage terminase large subunit-like protein